MTTEDLTSCSNHSCDLLMRPILSCEHFPGLRWQSPAARVDLLSVCLHASSLSALLLRYLHLEPPL